MKKMNRTAIDSANSVYRWNRFIHPARSLTRMRSATSPLEPFGNSEITRFESHWTRTKYDKLWQNMAYIYRFHQTLIRTCWALLSSIQHTCRYIEILPRHLLESGIVMACRFRCRPTIFLCHFIHSTATIYTCSCFSMHLKLYVCTLALLSTSASSTQLNYDFCCGLMTDDLYGVGFCLSRLCWLPNHPI